MSPVKPLIVDLDTGLLRTDLAREEFWRALGDGGWRTLLAGAPTSANYLEHASADDLANLPMTAAVLEAMRNARAAGRRVVLVTDAPDALAQRFAETLDLVDVLARRVLKILAERRLRPRGRWRLTSRLCVRINGSRTCWCSCR